MRSSVQKWGNSLALRIPKSLAVESGIDQGTVVDLSCVDGRLIVMPVLDWKSALEELLASVTNQNIHGEVDTGPSVGDESW
jgi:antitoxin MazE